MECESSSKFPADRRLFISFYYSLKWSLILFWWWVTSSEPNNVETKTELSLEQTQQLSIVSSIHLYEVCRFPLKSTLHAQTTRHVTLWWRCTAAQCINRKKNIVQCDLISMFVWWRGHERRPSWFLRTGRRPFLFQPSPRRPKCPPLATKQQLSTNKQIGSPTKQVWPKVTWPGSATIIQCHR